MLCSAFCAQLKDSNLSQSVAEQVRFEAIFLIPQQVLQIILFFKVCSRALTIIVLARFKFLKTFIYSKATKNMIYLTKVVKLIDPWINESKQEDLKEKNSDDQQKPITFKSLITKMCQLASYESSHAPKSTIKVF